MVSFDPKKVEQYVRKSQRNQFRAGAKSIACGSNIQYAIMAYFDKNKDGLVTIKEFDAQDKADYENYMASLSDYIAQNPEYNNSFGGINNRNITTYDEIERLFREKHMCFNIDALSGSGQKDYIRPNINIPEQRHKAPYFDEPESERRTEYSFFRNEYQEVSFRTVRKELNIHDEHSDVPDYHIGSFNQGRLGTCALLAGVNLMDDSEVEALYEPYVDENGEPCYKVDFPNDKRKHPVYVYVDDLENGYIELRNGTIIKDFSQGDEDVQIIEMAYIKRYGTDIINNGSSLENMMNRLFGIDAAKYTPTEELLQNNKKTITALHYLDDLKEIYEYDEENQTLTLDDGTIIRISQSQFSDGRHWTLILPGGIEIPGQHAMSVFDYDPETKQVLLSNPHENSTDQPVPYDLFKKLFFIAQ